MCSLSTNMTYNESIPHQTSTSIPWSTTHHFQPILSKYKLNQKAQHALSEFIQYNHPLGLFSFFYHSPMPIPYQAKEYVSTKTEQIKQYYDIVCFIFF